MRQIDPRRRYSGVLFLASSRFPNLMVIIQLGLATPAMRAQRHDGKASPSTYPELMMANSATVVDHALTDVNTFNLRWTLPRG
ncbi:hypothetical protein [Sphingobium sp. Ndbn-10]|uniref:hypothetical protein n=1 Tax=Sphingobium sp. Ndbn-10 TaxID=1667223 RepID=UPI001479B692|nr:hypothetical protein [Sphingobium sp. Ndbn-10]